jgi:Fe-S-cluster-containing dehydrogenase component
VEKRRPVDGDINTACAQACPADAIVFGDMKDPESAISKVINDENDARAYHMLEEIRVMPGITYLAKVRNKENA